MKTNLKLSPLVASVLATLSSLAAHAATPTEAPWLTQIGLTPTILAAANWGAGRILGAVDTGIVANNFMFAPGQVSSSLSSCAAVSFKCSNGVADDNGHGTAVASIAAGHAVTAGTYAYSGYTVPANSFIGVAPNANIVAGKVLNASGSGYNTDVSNGINKAVAAGVDVINLSLTYMATPDIVAAINNAAAHGVFIVWAGGNSSAALLGGASTSGLSPAAISHLVFVGATDTTAKSIASFSNTPGTGKLVNTSNQATAYSARWIVAPGTNILAPGAMYGPTSMAIWSGTSMAAPIVSGSLLLLEDAWPILKTNGTAENLLLATATDLGAKGTDTTYGAGLVNLTTAFQPYGSLSVLQPNGKTVAVSSLTGSLITGGALGSLTSVKTLLANYTAFDTYTRNYTVNLSGLIQTRATAAMVNPLPQYTNTGVRAMKFLDGSQMSTFQQPVNPMDKLGALHWSANDLPSIRPSYVSYLSADGSAMAFGYGVSSQGSFTSALFGNEALAGTASEFGTSNLASLADGGYHMAYGQKIGETARWAVAYSQSPVSATTPSASTSLLAGVTYKVTARLTGGFTVGTLAEQNGLLGTTSGSVDGTGLGLGNNRSTSMGVTMSYVLSRDSGFMLEVGQATTQAGQGGGLLVGTSTIQARSFGASFRAANLFARKDNLTLSFKEPLRVTSGTVGVLASGVAADGTPTFTTQYASLVPDGHEQDISVGYTATLGKASMAGFNLTSSKDALNIAGNRINTAMVNWVHTF